MSVNQLLDKAFDLVSEAREATADVFMQEELLNVLTAISIVRDDDQRAV